MKILSISSNYPRNSSDNFGWFVHELNKNVNNSGFEVIVLSPGCRYCLKDEAIDGVKIYRFRYFYPLKFERLAYGFGILQNIKQDYRAIFLLPFFLFFGIFKMIRLISQEKPDIIHAHWLIPSGFFGLIGKIIFHIPLVITVHGSDIRILPDSLKCILLKYADAIISPHPELTRIISKCNITPYSIPNLIIDNVVNQDVDPIDSNPEFYNKNIITFIGRLDDFKDPLTFIHSIPLILKQRVDIVFLIAGDGYLKDVMLQLIEHYGINENVIFLGWVENSNYLLKNTSVFVSLSPIENIWSLSLVEAMMHSIPCIVTNSGTTPLVLHDMEDSIFIRPKKPEELAEKILYLLENEEFGKIIGSSGKKMVDDLFNNQKNASRIYEIYSHIARMKHS